MVRSVKDILARSARTGGCVKHIHVTYRRPVVGAGKEMQKATLWQAPSNSIMARCRPGHDAILAQGLWGDVDPALGKGDAASPRKPLQRVRRQARPLRGGAQTL